MALLLATLMIMGAVPFSALAVQNNVAQNYVDEHNKKIADTVSLTESKRTGKSISGYSYVEYTEDTSYVYTSTYQSEASHNRYINGYPDKTVKPEASITRAEAVQMFYNLFHTYFIIYSDSTSAQTAAIPFTDVETGMWYTEAISALQNLSYISGDGDGRFRPNDPITRAEYAIMVSFVDDLSPTDTSAFTDLDGHWAEGLINAAANKGWITGYSDGTFRPDAYITRAEAVTLANKAMQREPDHIPSSFVNPYMDITASHWAYENMMEASATHAIGSWHNDASPVGLNIVTEKYVDQSGNEIADSATSAGETLSPPAVAGYAYSGYIKIITYVYQKTSSGGGSSGGSSTRYKVTYDANGGTGDVPVDSNSPYKSGASVTVLARDESLTREGYTFAGWSTKADGSGTLYQATDTFTIRANTTFYAQWTENTAPIAYYTVTYDANLPSYVDNEKTASLAGTVPTDSGSYRSGATVTVLDANNMVCTDVRDGTLTFMGWSTDAAETDEDNLYSKGDSFTIAEDTTLYAIWGMTLRYYNEGEHAEGDVAPPVTQIIGSRYTLENAEGLSDGSKKFVGWASRVSGAVRYAGETYDMPPYNVELVAVWSAEPYVMYHYNRAIKENNLTVTEFVVDDNNGRGYNAGDTYTIRSAEVVSEGWADDATHSFVGWSTTAGATEPKSVYDPGETYTFGTENLHLYAVWDFLGGDYDVKIASSGVIEGVRNFTTPSTQGITMVSQLSTTCNLSNHEAVISLNGNLYDKNNPENTIDLEYWSIGFDYQLVLDDGTVLETGTLATDLFGGVAGASNPYEFDTIPRGTSGTVTLVLENMKCNFKNTTFVPQGEELDLAFVLEWDVVLKDMDE